MTNEIKIEAIAEATELDVAELAEDQELDELESWDSVAVLSIISFISENFGRYPSAEEILSYKTVRDLMDAMA